MQRWKKRLWSGSLVGGSVVLIIAAVLMGTVRLVDLAAPRYRQVLANTITEAIEQPVEVGSIGMSWRRLRPTVDLANVVILHPQSRLPVFKLNAVQVPFKWSALMRGNFEPAEVILTGMALTLEWRADGSMGVKGIEMLGKPGTTEELDLDAIFAQLRELGHVMIRDSELAWLDMGGPPGLDHLSAVNAELLAAANEYSLTIEARLPEALGEEIRVQAFVEGETDVLDKLKTSINLQASGLSVQGWLQPVLQPGLELRGGPAEVEMQSQWLGLQPTSASLLLKAQPQAGWHAGELVRELPGVTADLSLTADKTGWQASINTLQYQNVGDIGPASQGSLEYSPMEGGFGDRITGKLDVARLSDLLAWTAVLAPSADIPIPAQAGGELRELDFSYERPPAQTPYVRVQANLRQLAMPVTGPLPGISGLDGELDYNGGTAKINLSSSNGQLTLPQVFSNPVPLTRLDTRLQARHTRKGWFVNSESLSLQAETVQAQGSLALELFNDEQSPVIDLQLDFAASDVLPAKPLIPIEPVLPTEVGEWLQDAILGGEVPQGEMVLRGPLAAFPYTGADEGKGEFRVEFDVVNALLEYAPDWPQVSEVSGHAVFAGQSMEINAESGKILAVPVANVQARIKDFAKPELTITGRVEAPLERQLEFLAESPLREDYQALLELLKISGPGALELELELPLEDLDATRVSGNVLLRGGRLEFADLPYPVTGLRGEVRFTGDGLSAEGVKGKFLGLPAEADLSPLSNADGAGTRLQAAVQLSLPQDGDALRQLLGEDLPLGALSGTTRVNVATRFSADGEVGKLQISSDLRGMASDFGAPLNKEAEDARSLRVGVLPDEERLLIDWDYLEALHGQVELLADGESWRVNRGTVRLGPWDAAQPPVLPAGTGWDIRGDLPVLDLQGLSMGGAGDLPELQVLNVHVGLLKLAGQQIGDIRLRLDAAGNLLHLSGADSEGQVRWKRSGQRMLVDADFRRLVLSAPKKLPGQPEKKAMIEAEAINPAVLPGLDLNIEQLILNDEVLGRLKMQARPLPAGLQLTTFNLQGKKLKLQGNGEWIRQQGKSTGKLTGNFNTDDITDILKAAGYAPNIVAEAAKGSLDIYWAPHADGLMTEALNGELGFEFTNGSLLAVDPGAGRVLSLLSFYSIPRRLTLDFSDVMGKGTAFDKLDGKFRIEDGNAYTRNLEVKSPSMEIEVQGRVGLAARDYDQIVTIKPEVSASVTLVGTLLGGPVLGIGLWLTQELLDDPLEQASVLIYRLHGSWDDPVVEPLKVKPVKPRTREEPRGAQKPPKSPPADAPSGPRK